MSPSSVHVCDCGPGKETGSMDDHSGLQHTEDKPLQFLFSVKISIINNNLPPSWSNVFQGTGNKYFISHGLRWVNFVFAVQCYNLILLTNRHIYVEEGTLQSYCNHENYHGTSSVHVQLRCLIG